MLGGVASPNEAASVGAVGAILMAGRKAGAPQWLILSGAAALLLLAVAAGLAPVRLQRSDVGAGGTFAARAEPKIWLGQATRYTTPAAGANPWDLGAAIPWTYETGRIGASDGSLALFRKLTVNAEGAGYLAPTIVRADTQLVPLLSFTLYSPMRGTQHVLCNVKDERVALRFQLSGLGARVTLHRAALWMRRHPFADYRPRNP